MKKFLLVYHALFFLSFFLMGNIGCTKKMNLGKTLSGSFAKHKSFFPSFFATATNWKIPFSAILPVEPPREKERQRGELIARAKLKPRMPLPRVKIHVFNIFFFFFCRRCCRAHRRRCRLPPTHRRASWCRRLRYHQATWPWALAAAHLPCQVGTLGEAGGGGGRNLGVSVAPRAFFFRRWSLVPARDNGDVTGPGPRPSHCPRCPADPQRPGKNFPPQISILCNVLNRCSEENPQFLNKFNPWSILNF